MIARSSQACILLVMFLLVVVCPVIQGFVSRRFEKKLPVRSVMMKHPFTAPQWIRSLFGKIEKKTITIRSRNIEGDEVSRNVEMESQHQFQMAQKLYGPLLRNNQLMLKFEALQDGDTLVVDDSSLKTRIGHLEGARGNDDRIRELKVRIVTFILLL